MISIFDKIQKIYLFTDGMPKTRSRSAMLRMITKWQAMPDPIPNFHKTRSPIIQNEQWLFNSYEGKNTNLQLENIDFSISLEEIYKKVTIYTKYYSD